MNILKLLLILIGTFSLFTFIVLFGHIPTLRKTPIGFVHRILLRTIPRWCIALDRRITGGKLLGFTSRIYHNMMNERHPAVLIMYLVLLSGGILIFLTRVASKLSRTHWFLIPILVIIPYLTLYLAAYTDPGFIVSHNHYKYLGEFEYDQIMFRGDDECATCKRQKPARSKHCSLCKRCVAKHDHHCIWINSCVGRNNMKWFLAFLLSNVITFTYATVTLYRVLSSERVSLLDHIASAKPGSLTHLKTGQIQTWLQVLRLDVSVGSLFLFAAICDILVASFSLYHCYLVFSGVTTNESLKLEDVKSAIASGSLAIHRDAHGKHFLGKSDRPGAVSLEEAVNIYDRGWRQNLMDVLVVD